MGKIVEFFRSVPRMEALPHGVYNVEVDSVMIAKSTAGEFAMETVYKVIDGPYKGRELREISRM